MQAGCAPGNLDSGGMGTGGGTSSWPCPFTHKCNAFAPNGHTHVHSHTCSPRHWHTSSVCAHTPTGSLGPGGCCTPTHSPTPTFPHPGHGRRLPLPSRPPALPRGRSSCLRCWSRLPGPPSTGGATGASLVLLPLPCLAPVLMDSRLTAAWDHPTDARPRLVPLFWEQQQEILTGKRAGPRVALAWAGCHQAAVCGVWVPLPGTSRCAGVGMSQHLRTLRLERSPLPRWGARGTFYARGPGVSQGAEGGIQPWAGPTVPHSPAPSHAVRSQAQLIPAPDLWGN